MDILGLIAFVGTLAAITVRNFIRAQQKSRVAVVKSNMRVCQIAAEAYALDHAGLFPESINAGEFRSYFPGGQPPDKPGIPPSNPFTGLPEWPIDGRSAESAAAAVFSAPLRIGVGVVEYSALFNQEREPLNYAIRGGDQTGQAILASAGTALVLTKH